MADTRNGSKMKKMIIVRYKLNPHIKKDISDLLIEAFPESERPPVDIFFGNVNRNKENELYGYYERDKFIGFSYLTLYKDICYLFFLAVKKEERNKGFGTKILDLIKKEHKDKVILLCNEEVDDKYLDNDLRIKRRDFYIKNGFVYNGYKTNEFGVIFETRYFGNHPVPFEDYSEIYVLGFSEYARKYLKKVI